MGVSSDPRFVNPIKTYTPKGENFDRVSHDQIVYQGRPFGIIGVFYGPDDNFYITTSSSIERIFPQK